MIVSDVRMLCMHASYHVSYHMIFLMFRSTTLLYTDQVQQYRRTDVSSLSFVEAENVFVETPESRYARVDTGVVGSQVPAAGPQAATHHTPPSIQPPTNSHGCTSTYITALSSIRKNIMWFTTAECRFCFPCFFILRLEGGAAAGGGGHRSQGIGDTLAVYSYIRVW